eukprot:CAMPEP_0118923106 /NCGR_PEP_ID=MMETSP1169-20130426/1759_1 /TAXON_ID=36882 /ORGANISM="Pyramimonas obovata, Strain CCMP722" /LENGTH=328 /DNA_ID=CAMNT_0006864049 /DNA_START=113 /DNA_END=1096 /DNA_ORIENTATION=+
MRKSQLMMMPGGKEKSKYLSDKHRQMLERFQSLAEKSRELTGDGKSEMLEEGPSSSSKKDEVLGTTRRREKSTQPGERAGGESHLDEEMGAKPKEKNQTASWKDKNKQERSFGLQSSVQDIMLTSYLNGLIILIPFAMMAKDHDWGDAWLFFLSLLPICPLAERLGHVTEQLASYTNPTVGGLLNATFGNMTEIIVSFYALKAGKLRIVQLSLMGSVLSNMLLVLGCAFVAGGMKHKVQHFNRQGVNISAALLLLAVTSLSIPSVLNATHSQMEKESGVIFSRYTSCLLLVMYCLFLYFQLITHRDMYEEEEDEDEDGEKEEEEEDEK